MGSAGIAGVYRQTLDAADENIMRLFFRVAMIE
jgi:hypothetical protein